MRNLDFLCIKSFPFPWHKALGHFHVVISLQRYARAPPVRLLGTIPFLLFTSAGKVSIENSLY